MAGPCPSCGARGKMLVLLPDTWWAWRHVWLCLHFLASVWLFCVFDSASPGPLAFRFYAFSKIPFLWSQRSPVCVQWVIWHRPWLFGICCLAVLPLALPQALSCEHWNFLWGVWNRRALLSCESLLPGGCTACESRRRRSLWGLRAELRGGWDPCTPSGG